MTIPMAEAPKLRRKGATALDLLWVAVAVSIFTAAGAVIRMGTLSTDVGRLNGQVTQLKTQVTANRTATYQSRSVGCRLLLGHGVKIADDDPCNDPNVLRYYEPEEIEAGATSEDALENRTITCHVLRRLGEDLPSCAGL